MMPLSALIISFQELLAEGHSKPYGYIFSSHFRNSNVNADSLIFPYWLHGEHRMPSICFFNFFFLIIFREDQCGMQNELPLKSTFLGNGFARHLGLFSIQVGSLGLLNCHHSRHFYNFVLGGCSWKILGPTLHLNMQISIYHQDLQAVRRISL